MKIRSVEKEEIKKKKLRHSVIIIHKKNDLSLEGEKKGYIKRSSSMSLNIPKNFVPKLKPKETIICPSPINLNLQPTSKITEKNNNNKIYISNPHKDLIIKPIKLFYAKKRNLRKSSNILNIDEETHETEAISEREGRPRKVSLWDSDSESSNYGFEEDDKNKKDKIDILKNINFIREKMIMIKRNSIRNDNINDDSTISNRYALKRLNQYKTIYHQKFIDRIKRNKNMNLNLSKPINRTKSFHAKQRYVPTILGFLENNKNRNSLNSTGK